MTTTQQNERVTFSFGENWERFLDEIHPKALERMAAYVADWLGSDLTGRTLIDIGSGQGLTSLVAHQAGGRVTSVDVDPRSVAATSRLRTAAGDPTDWQALRGSILDPTFVSSLGSFDDVVSWGSPPPHWGRMDRDRQRRLPGAPRGPALDRLVHAYIFQRTKSSYEAPLQSRSPPTPHRRTWRGGVRRRQARPVRLPTAASSAQLRRYHEERGMDWSRDIEDWLGWPALRARRPRARSSHACGRCGFQSRPIWSDALGEGANDVYLFRRAHAGG